MEDVCRMLDREWRKQNMKHQYIVIVIALVVGYYVGMKYPSFWAQLGS